MKEAAMKIEAKDYRVGKGERVRLKDWPTKGKALCATKEEYAEALASHVKRLSGLQELLYGSNKYALLLVFQGMDAAGKDGAIRHVMSGVNPQGCEVASFKQPSAEELEHDFLWRSTVRLPERGRIGIFNRSYYEEVLAVRVHPEDLRGEGLAAELRQEGCVEGAVPVDCGAGAAPAQEWDAGGEDLSASVEGGAAAAVSGADR
jgi:polyphosphate kinase 2 (PPK2 family)